MWTHHHLSIKAACKTNKENLLLTETHRRYSSEHSLISCISYHVTTMCFYFKLPITDAKVWTTWMYFFVPSNSCEWSKNWNLKMLHNMTVSDGRGQFQNFKHLLALMLNWATTDTHFVTQYHSALKDCQGKGHLQSGTSVVQAGVCFCQRKHLQILLFMCYTNPKLIMGNVC